MDKGLYHISNKGGIFSPAEMQQHITAAERMGLDYFYFGSRQEIIFPQHTKQGISIEDSEAFKPELFVSEHHPNITCSYVSIDIFDATVWLRGTTYLYILEQFRYEPQLKINITDPLQQMVPLYTGNLNFIASTHEDYWFLFLKLPGWEEAFYPVLIYTWDIAKVAKAIEHIYLEKSSIDEIFKHLNKHVDTNNRVIDKALKVPAKPFPYYEGMNKMENGNYWLGLYWRNNQYDLVFLKKLCEFCIEHRIGKICLTPWKSFVIKGIPASAKLELEKLLGQSGINIRHSALELNWHLPVTNPKALELKRFLVRTFDQNDISTYGMTFAISINESPDSYFTTIVIEENPISEAIKNFVVRPTFNILHAKNFDPNSIQYQGYAQDVDQMDLPGLLLELTKIYFKNLGEVQEENVPTVSSEKETVTLEVYQCKDCQTVYDPSIGDATAGVDPGTEFSEVSEDYQCALCEAKKSNFEKIEMKVC